MKTMILALILGLSAFVSAQNCQVGNSCNGTVSASDGGNCTTANACVSLPLAQNTGAVGLSLGGTFTATIQFEASADNGATWNGISGTPLGSTTTQLAATGTGAWRFAVSGLTNIRVRGSAYTSGSATVTFQTSPTAASLGGGGAGITTFDQLGAGTNVGNAFGIGAGGSLAPTGGGTITANVGAFNGATQYFFSVFGASGTIGNSLCSTDAGLTLLTCTYTGGLSIGGSGSGKVTLSGLTSGSAAIQVAAVAGTPNPLQLPTATGTSGFFLKTDGGSPQQLSWAAAGGSPCTVTASSLQYNNAGAFGCVTDFTFSGHTITSAAAGLLDLSAQTGIGSFKVPVVAGFVPTANGSLGYDSTANLFVGGVNGSTGKLPYFTGTNPTNNDCAKWTTGGVLADQGAICNAGTVTSVAATVPAQFAVANSPVTATGTLAITRVDPQLNTYDVNYPGVYMPNVRITRFAQNNGTNGFNSIGETATESGGTTSQSIAITNTTPPLTGETTTATTGNNAGITGQTKRRTGRTNGIIAQAGVQNVTSAANVRWFIGLADQTLSTMLAGNVPAGNFVGVEFDSNTGTYTGLTDTTHYVCIVKDNTTEVATSTGNAGDTAFHRWAFVEATSTSWKIYMDGVQVCGTQSSHVPLTNTNLNWVHGVQTLANVGLQVGTAYVWASEQF